MTSINWTSIIAAYRNGLTTDIIQAKYESGEGVLWTVPPCDPDAARHAGRQFSRSRAISIRHIRRAVLHRRDQPDQIVVIATELPARRQQVRDLETAEEAPLRCYLRDATLVALETAFLPSAVEAV